ncbi:hypothetical protein V1264_024448 [Littorina saxatilis]|uniref:CUB domain-containing protein n=1 Tax=Littorina saxatilis TaxID=31220 RepID=A0AAN9FZQ5_9CAEN
MSSNLSCRNCTDFVRIFQNLERPEVNENSRWDVELCGNISSLKRKNFYSSDRSLILEFHSESLRNHKFRGFSGIYQFLDKRNYITTGRRVEGQPCTYEFFSNSSHKSKSGKFFSPFYPQIYKPNSRCRYHLHALPGERVRVVFSNIQLHNRDTRYAY